MTGFFDSLLVPVQNQLKASFSASEKQVNELKAQLAAIPKSAQVQVGITQESFCSNFAFVGSRARGCKSFSIRSVPVFEKRFTVEEAAQAAEIQARIDELQSMAIGEFNKLNAPDLQTILTANKNIIIPAAIIGGILILAK